jgi:hypothetical protein
MSFRSVASNLQIMLNKISYRMLLEMIYAKSRLG